MVHVLSEELTDSDRYKVAKTLSSMKSISLEERKKKTYAYAQKVNIELEKFPKPNIEAPPYK